MSRFFGELFFFSTCIITRVLGQAFSFTSLVRSGNVIALELLSRSTEGGTNAIVGYVYYS